MLMFENAEYRIEFDREDFSICIDMKDGALRQRLNFSTWKPMHFGVTEDDIDQVKSWICGAGFDRVSSTRIEVFFYHLIQLKRKQLSEKFAHFKHHGTCECGEDVFSNPDITARKFSVCFTCGKINYFDRQATMIIYKTGSLVLSLTKDLVDGHFMTINDTVYGWTEQHTYRPCMPKAVPNLFDITEDDVQQVDMDFSTAGQNIVKLKHKAEMYYRKLLELKRLQAQQLIGQTGWTVPDYGDLSTNTVLRCQVCATMMHCLQTFDVEHKEKSVKHLCTSCGSEINAVFKDW